MKIGIIGFGRLGKLLATYLAQDSTLLVFEPNKDVTKNISKIGAKAASIAEVCACPIVIPCVPISEFQNVLKDMKPHLKEGTLVADVCSVKMKPVEDMKNILPENVSLLGTHPMFGPDSAAKTLYGSKIVLTKVRLPDEQYKNIKSYLETHGLKVIEATQEEHDKQISSSLLLTHLLGRTLMDFEAGPLDIDTKGYRRLMKILETVENDSWQLFVDMNKYNPFAKETFNQFKDSLSDVIKKVNE